MSTYPQAEPSMGAQLMNLSGHPRLGGPDWERLLAAVRLVQDRVVRSGAPHEVVAQAADQAEALAATLGDHQVDEGRGPTNRRPDLADRGSLLLYPVIIDEQDDEHTVGRVTFRPYDVGGNAAVHGGMLGLLFDEVLGALANRGGRAIARTAYLHIDYRSVTPIERELTVTARLVGHSGRKIEVVGALHDGERLCAEVHALFVQLLPGQP